MIGRRCVVLGTACAALAGCGHAASHVSAPRSLDGCVRAGPATAIVRFRAGGEQVPAAVLGNGRTGVVLSNESDLGLCSWLPFARTLAGKGFRVLLYDYRNEAPPIEAVAAARELGRLGARRVVLAGASEGAKVSILAAAAHPSLAAAVVALSPEAHLGAEPVAPAARKLSAPVLFAVSQADPYSATDTPALERAAGSARKRLVLVPGSAHGVALLRGAPAATVASAVYGFLAPFGPARRPPALASECGIHVAGARPVAFTAGDGVRLHGDVLGSGDTTVVLAHEFPASLCGWFPYASELAHDGLRVLAFDSRVGDRLDLDVAAAADEARSLGASKVVAMGASMGGFATLAAAGRDCFLVSGVVSDSGETDLSSYGRGTIARWEPRIAAPLLVVGSRGDPLIPAAQVRTLLARVASKQKRAVLVDGTGHGWSLLQGAEASERIRTAVLDFLRSAGPPVATGC